MRVGARGTFTVYSILCLSCELSSSIFMIYSLEFYRCPKQWSFSSPSLPPTMQPRQPQPKCNPDCISTPLHWDPQRPAALWGSCPPTSSTDPRFHASPHQHEVVVHGIASWTLAHELGSLPKPTKCEIRQRPHTLYAKTTHVDVDSIYIYGIY